jgi:hypothetical protein
MEIRSHAPCLPGSKKKGTPRHPTSFLRVQHLKIGFKKSKKVYTKYLLLENAGF